MNSSTSRTNLVLLELIFNLFLFLICAVVCVSLTFYAKDISEQSTRLTRAVYAAQTAAETYKNGQTMPTSYTEEEYGLNVEIIELDDTATINVSYKGELVYSIEEVHGIEK